MTDEAAAPTETATETTTTETTTTVDNSQTVADMVGSTNDFDFVLDKYRADGRTDQDAAMEQAKAYGELQSKFGAFTGAPEEYEFKLSEEMSERVNLDDYKDDPLLGEFKEKAKELGINNDAFNSLVEMHFKSNLVNEEAQEVAHADEMKALGSKATQRLDNIESWAKANLDAQTGESLLGGLTSATMVQAVEALISQTRNASQIQETISGPSITHDQVREWANEKDEFGNSKMQTSPEHRAKVRNGYSQLFGDEPQNVIVGR